MSGSVGSFNPHALRAIGAGASPEPAGKTELAARRVREQHDMAVRAASALSTLSMMFPGRVGGDLALSNGDAADLAEILASRLTSIEECAHNWPSIETATKLALAGAASRLGSQPKCGAHRGSSMHDAVNTAIRAASTLWGAVKPPERHAVALTNIQSHFRAGWSLLGDQLPEFDLESVRISLEREAAGAIEFLTEPSKQTALVVPEDAGDESKTVDRRNGKWAKVHALLDNELDSDSWDDTTRRQKTDEWNKQHGLGLTNSKLGELIRGRRKRPKSDD